jgi:hypothetical protein
MSADISKPRVFRRTRGHLEPSLRPIVVEFETQHEKQAKTQRGPRAERYTRGLADFQQAEVDLLAVMRRATRAIALGVETYEHERAKSAKTKTDGAIIDFPHNSAKALSETIREASEIPVDVADAMTTQNYRRRVHRNLRNVAKALRVFRM